MTFNNAKGLHNEDEVTIKETGEIVTVLQAYPLENGKYIVLECDDGNTYYNDEVKWNDDLLRKVRKTSMKHLVIFYTENGIYSAVYNFKNIPPTTEDIKEMQKDIQKTESLIQMPAVVNWLPISD